MAIKPIVGLVGEGSVVRWRSDRGCMSAIVVTEGPKWWTLLPMESGKVRLVKIPASVVSNRLTPIEYKSDWYPLERAKRSFKRHSKKYGITSSAKKVLYA